jgi:Dolichyl-phosphate-mannose-protein mannosyltransferase
MPTLEDEERSSERSSLGLSGQTWWLGCALVFLGALLATVPTTGDIGLTWDEPSYRTSQLISSQWWEALPKVRTRADFNSLFSADALLYYWPYGRYGYNFHPPLAGQLNLLTHAIFGRWMKDIPSRRMASVIEYCLTITMAFGFLSKRYGAWVGGVAAGALLVMPRVYGDGHIAGTDTPGLLLWAVTALAFWKGLYEPHAGKWRVLVGIAMGLGFVEKMAAVAVLGPLLLWLVATRLPATFRRGGKSDWIDGIVTSTAMLLPIGVALREVLRLARELPPPANVDLFRMHPPTPLPGAILLLPLVVWMLRRLAKVVFPRHRIWGAERPALEIWTAVLAFAPVVGWLGNPAWWRETLPRLAHYYQLNADRRGALPDIRIIYFGEVYTYSLPWHNAWVLIAITVPAGILLASLVGLGWSLARSWKLRDAIPWYFALHLVFLPVLRMLPTPAHDGVRLFLPTFFFLAAFAGWGVVAIGDALLDLSRRVGLALPFLIRLKRQGKPYPTGKRGFAGRAVVAALVLGSAAWQLAAIHPFELSYYNELIGGPRGAWKRGFELSYWYEAFDDETLANLNRDLPKDAAVYFFNDLINTPTFACLQELGALRGDIVPDSRSENSIPFGWCLAHDSKATSMTRLMFAMKPFYPRTPKQLDGLQVATVITPEAVSRAWALDLLTRGAAGLAEEPRAPGWIRGSPWFRPLARFWGEGLTLAPPRALDEGIFTWAKNDPEGLRAAARVIAERKPIDPGSPAARLMSYLDRPLFGDQRPWRKWVGQLLNNRPEALSEAVEILIKRPEAVRSVLLRAGYTDEASIGGFLDRDVVQGKP